MSTNENLIRRLHPGFGARALLAVIIAGTLRTGIAETPAAPAFDSPEQAIAALYKAVNKGDGATVTQLIGPLATTSDTVRDKADRALFIRKYSEMHRLVRQSDGTVVLHVGAENWPFPVPLVADHGKWRFDQDAGAREIVFRRIGENEMTAIETCRAIAHPDGKTEDASVKEYARKVVDATTPLSEAFHDYYFRTVRTSGGTAVVAYPAEYGETGIMTFAVTPNGVLYEKDLGPNTPGIARAITQYRPDRTWHPAEQ